MTSSANERLSSISAGKVGTERENWKGWNEKRALRSFAEYFCVFRVPVIPRRLNALAT
jgi:hypothetical protein